MNQSFSQSLSEIREVVISLDSFHDDIQLLEFDHSAIDGLRRFVPLNPSRFDSFIFIGVENGNMEIQIDYVNYVASKNSFVIIMPSHITTFLNGSNDFRGWVFSVSENYLTSLSHSKQPVVISYLQVKQNPIIAFNDSEFKALYTSFCSLRRNVRKRLHIFHDELVNLSVKMFFLELGNLYISASECQTTHSTSRTEELYLDFQKLLMTNCIKHHDVAFYADTLCITTQYLTHILKQHSGRSASQWLGEALLTEAKSMLKAPRTTIQQVAEALNFSDPSAFGKFFRKHTGMTPFMYRNKT